MTNKKILIAYFSRKGENYVDGKIINLPIGNTEVVAGYIQNLTSGDMFKIDTINAYPTDYTETTKVATKELNEQARPKLTVKVEDMNSYDVIFLGYPNWWGTFPMAVFTFLESYDFSGKTIIPFCTHEGSGLGKSVSDISKLCTKSAILEGLEIRGSNVANSQNEINAWINKIKN